jgi:hypothetical protein
LAVTATTATKVRRGIVYGYHVYHPETGQVVIGYVGQTRWPDLRDEQHREKQPWADTIVGDIFVIDEGDWDEGELDARELAYINAYQPLYNIVGNRRNPHRIKPWVAKRQRHARDRAAGRPLWQPPHPVNVSRRRPLRPSRRTEPLALPQVRVGWGWVVPVQVWLVGTAGLGWLTGQWPASVAATGVVAVGLGGWRAYRRRRR